MIKIFKGTDVYTLCDYRDITVTLQDLGMKTMSFSVSPKEPLYQHLTEETLVQFEDDIFVIKKINEYRNDSKIECDLCLDDFYEHAHFFYEHVELTLTVHLLTALLDTGWTVSNAESVTSYRTVRLENCNTMDILNELQKLFDVKFQYDTINKTITIVKYREIQPKGVYFIDELNLREISFKGDTTEFATKLICRGAENEDGTFVTFAEINDGKDYITNNTYSDKIITKLFSDERFTTAQALKDEAIERLKVLAVPNRSYECSVIDLASVKPEYSELSYGLYDMVILIDRNRKTRLEHRIVQITKYPQKPESNTAVLSTVAGKIETTIKQVDSIVNNAGQLAIDGKSLNELKRDGTYNSALIRNTYTKGEIEYQIENAISQTENAFQVSISETKEIVDQTQARVDDLENFKDSGEIRNTTVTVDINGVTVGKNDSEVSTVIDNEGMEIQVRNTDETQPKNIIAVYDKDGAKLKNLTVQNEAYLGYLRFLKADVNGQQRCHVHWCDTIGG